MLIISLALGCGIATAQEGQDQASDEGEFTLEEIVVTGSRIPRRDYKSSSPIVTIKADTFEDRSNIGIESALNQLPQFTPAGTQLIGQFSLLAASFSDGFTGSRNSKPERFGNK